MDGRNIAEEKPKEKDVSGLRIRTISKLSIHVVDKAVACEGLMKIVELFLKATLFGGQKLPDWVTKELINGFIMKLYDTFCMRTTLDPTPALERVVQSQGDYTFESYEIRTVDDFPLQIHRVRSKTFNNNLPPIYFQHGLLSSSADFLLKDGLAYSLADNGRDVWLGNFRGNIFSRRKLREEINDELFWGHDIDDHSTIDLPTMLDFVLQQTKRDNLIYIGHSMGATSLFILCDTKPEYNDKIQEAYLLAPVGDLGKINGRPKNVLKSAELFLKVLEMLNIYTLFFPRLIPGWTMIGILVFQISGYNSVTSDIDCDLDKVKDILKFSPSGSTTKSILQYLKCHDKKKLVSSDAKNQAVTSEYSLAKTTIPITILWAQRDVYAGAENMAEMKKDLPNIVGMYQMNDSYGHLDFIWEAKPATKILNELIIQRQLPQVNDLPEADETYNQPANAPKTSVWGILSTAWKEYCKSEAQEDDE